MLINIDRSFQLSIRAAINVILILMCVACSYTNYQSRDWRGGYIDRKLSDNSYEVIYIGNGNLNTKQIVDYAVLRASIIGKEHQAPFAVINLDYLYVDKFALGETGVNARKAVVKILVELKYEKQGYILGNCGDVALIALSGIAQFRNTPFKIKIESCIELLVQKYGI